MRSMYIFVIVAVLWAAPCSALEAVMEVTGAVQGVFEAGGNNVDQGPSRYFTVLKYSHTADRPLDAKTGLPAEPRSQGKFTIIKYVDRSAPRFWQAFLSNEPLNCRLRLTQDGLDGELDQFYTVELNGARIQSISERLPFPVSRVEGLPHIQTISFVFTRITWTHNGASISAMDALQ